MTEPLTDIPRRPRLRNFRHGPSVPPLPPVALPPAATVTVPGRGEIFYRDSGGDGPLVLLLHGWAVTGDLNWAEMAAPLQAAGHRIVWLDHRGHGRGIRSSALFRLTDCADDAAGLLQALGAEGAIVVGYSMGGTIAQLLARRHPELVGGIVLGATSNHWDDPRDRRLWRLMVLARLTFNVFPYAAWGGAARSAGYDPVTAEWVAGELMRGSGRDIAEAGRELGRFDSRPWAGSLGKPAAVIVTTSDRDVPPHNQRALAESVDARVFEVPAGHFAVTSPRFAEALLPALAHVAAAAG